MGRQLSSGKNLVVFIFFLFLSFISLTAIILTNSLLAQATTSLSPDLNINVGSSVSLLLTNCDGSNSSVLKLAIDPTPTGTFKSACQTTSVGTNTPGYSLTVRATGTNANHNSGAVTNSLLYLNPNSLTTLPTIPATTNPIASPSTLDSNTWGFAVEGIDSFDATYTANDENNNYAQLPTTDTTVYNTTEWPINTTDHTFYYATKVDTDTTAGTYGTTITYTAIGENIPPAPKTCKNQNSECIMFTVDTTADGTYYIPTSGHMISSSIAKSYNWDVYVDGYLTDACVDGNCIGVSSNTTYGIALTGLSLNQHQILIVSHNSPEPGWGNAFGHTYSNYTNGANSSLNKQKLISLDAPFTTMAFAPKITEGDGTNASYMFANLFSGCSNLTTTMQILNTYTLPDTIITFTDFLFNTHYSNSKLTEPIDLSPLTNWFNANNTIEDLSFFLQSTHNGNLTLTEPIDLSPIKNWFVSNNSITELAYFLYATHWNNSVLTIPLDLTPVSGWFKNNTSIINLSRFMYNIHSGNYQMTKQINLRPLENWFKSNNSIEDLSSFLYGAHSFNFQATDSIDLSPLSGWFNANNSIKDLSYFLASTQTNNSQIDSINLSPLSGWFNANNSIKDLSYFLASTHNSSTKLINPINLSPLSGWFSANNSIENLSNFLYQTHMTNTRLTSPINLEPIRNWFNLNTSIDNLSHFFNGTHNSNPQLTTPINLIPLSGWFSANHTVITLTGGFMMQTNSNPSTVDTNNLVLSGQTILPNWMKTMVNGSGTPIWDTGTSNTNYSFYRTYYSAIATSNTYEVKFEDDTVLSSVGEPSANRETYNGRTGISPLNNTNGRWKSN